MECYMTKGNKFESLFTYLNIIFISGNYTVKKNL